MNHPDLYYYVNPPESDLIDKDKSRLIAERVGHEVVILTLVESGAFNIQGKTPLQSVRSTDTLEALRFIALKNATI